MYARHLNDAFPLSSLGGAVSQIIDRLFYESEALTFLDTHKIAFPAINVWEDDNSVFVETELPGMTLDAIDIQLLGKKLTIKGERSTTHDENVKQHRRERYSGSFERELTIPVEIDADRVRADLRDGVLTVTLPKAAAARARKIEVNFKNN